MLRRLTAALLACTLVVAGACGDDGGDETDSGPESEGGAARSASGGELVGPADEGIDGVQAYRVASNDHTEEDLEYDPSPPVGGDHFPVPATCGFYEAATAPPEELLVHSLEHAAIWVAYDPELDDTQLTALRDLVAGQAKVVATPHEALDTPLVVSSWARQLPLDSVDDPRLVQFIEAYRNSDNAPEPEAACQGVGEPAVTAPAA